MRPRGSVTGPLILIAVGALFLLRTISPDFRVFEMLSRFWPYFLIVWGLLQLIEVLIRGSRGGPIPLNGLSAGSWGLVLLVVFIGYASWEWQTPENWWRHTGLDHSIEVLGQAHDYSFRLIRLPATGAPRIVIESFRGDAKITGTEANEITVSGHKTIRAMDSAAADRANGQSGVEAIAQGNTIVIRCNQDRSSDHIQITTDLQISVPRGAMLEATGRTGDFEVAGIRSVDLSSDNAGVRVENVTGDVKVDTRKSDQVTCSGVRGAVTLRGHGDDVDLSQVGGPISVIGDYSGTISVHEVLKPVRIESMRTQLEAQGVPGSLTLARGSLDVQNVLGPVKVATESTDVSLNNFTEGLELAVDRGDIDIKPGRTPLSRMVIRTRSGNIDLALPQHATFALSATAGHGEIENEFSDALKAQSEDHATRLEGSIGSGPELKVTTDRGGITLRKAGQSEDKSASVAPPPKPPQPPGEPQI